ncbi:Gfo/Idh/MocA family oxidoreductase [Moorellaceae bacterium AZ2]
MLSIEACGVAVLGIGRAGMVHARNFVESVPMAKLVAIYDVEKERVEAAAGELGVKGYTDLEKVLGDPAIDAVVVAAPTFAHRDLVVAAAKGKKAILCEKPLTLTLEEAEDMRRAVEENGVVFVMGFMRRYDASFMRAKELLENGEIGDPLIIRSVGKGPSLPPRWAWDVKKSNGVLGEVNSHDFDTVYWLMGSEYSWVYARGKNMRCEDLREEFPDFYDHALVMFELKNGCMGTVEGACPSEYGYDARVEIQGTKGVLFIGDIAEHGVTVCSKGKGASRSLVQSWRSLFREAYIREDRHLIECLSKGAKPRTTVEDGTRALKVVRAANRSLVTGEVVHL